VTGDREQRNRVLGVPLRTGPHARQAEEPQRVLGFPVDWLDSAGGGPLPALPHPIRGIKRWARRRMRGPYAAGEDGRQQGADPRLHRASEPRFRR
jgi:hypothetical protein